MMTPRNLEIIELMANGHTMQEVGDKLHLSIRTVETHIAKCKKKIGAKNLPHLVLICMRCGWIK